MNDFKIKKKMLQIAYFSMEFGLNKNMNTYCGGLGILAGDTVKSASDMGLSMVGVSLLYKNGWLKQEIDNQLGQTEQPDQWDYKNFLTLRPETFTLRIKNQDVLVHIWQYLVSSNPLNPVPIFFLDIDLPENSEEMRAVNDVIYSGDKNIWYCQETLLGLGGAMALEALGYNDIDIFHLNESHAAYLTLFLREKYGSWEAVQQKLCFTTHTPLAGAHQKLQLNTVQQYIDTVYSQHISENVLDEGNLDFSKLCFFASKFSNAVANRHKEITSQMYPDFKIDYITNGVHHPTWIADPMQKVFDDNIFDWKQNPDYLRQAIRLDDELVINAHKESKQLLIDFINKQKNDRDDQNIFDVNAFTIGFARRAVPYKRAHFIFQDFEKLQEISKNVGSIQIVFAGKTSGNDVEGKANILKVLEFAKKSNKTLNIFYIENYNMDVAEKMVSGVDVWLNTPLPPLEASGTSGMKTALNGIPSFSVLDGWWPEGHIEGVTGWSIGQYQCDGEICRILETSDIYEKLEKTILPLFYKNKTDWTKIMKSCIAFNGSHFNTNRMLCEYLIKGYLKVV